MEVNYTCISSNCSNKTVTYTTYNFGCLIGYCIDVTMICIIVPFNIWALWLIRKRTTTQRGFASSELLHFNLIFSSLIFCIAYIHNGLFTFQMPGIDFLISGYILAISLIAQVQFHTWICIEHYLAVVYPIFYLKLKQFWYKMVWVSFTWVTSFVFGGLGLFLQHQIALIVHIIPFCGLVFLMLFCSVATLATLKKDKPAEGQRGQGMHQQKMKAFKIITLTLMLLIFTYFPYILLVLIWQELNPEIICIAQSVILSFLLLGAVFQALLYILRFFKA